MVIGVKESSLGNIISTQGRNEGLNSGNGARREEIFKTPPCKISSP